MWVTLRDQMQAHKEGNKHKRKTDKVVKHSCPICLIEVTCKDILENQYEGRGSYEEGATAGREGEDGTEKLHG